MRPFEQVLNTFAEPMRRPVEACSPSCAPVALASPDAAPLDVAVELAMPRPVKLSGYRASGSRTAESKKRAIRSGHYKSLYVRFMVMRAIQKGKTDMPADVIAKAVEAPVLPEGCEDVLAVGGRGIVQQWDW